jgi:ferric-dicitrate binding protein FerR (iron transport regulator)
MEYQHFSAEDFATDDFFTRWVKGSDLEANRFWKSFLEVYPEKAAEIAEARKMISVLQFHEESLTDQDILSMRSRILMSVHEDKELQKDNRLKSLRKNKRLRMTFWVRWAAIISLPLSLLAIAYLLTNRPKQLNNATPFLQGLSDSEIEKRINPKGQKSALLLSDGTKVWLNADSRLDYSKTFGSTITREVYLEGEAFFEVAPNKSKPFIVHTTDISVKVLGTAFNVKSYPNERTIETTLVHGKVNIYKKGEDKANGGLILRPNQRAVFTRESNTVNVEQVLADRATSWRLEKLIFDETPLYDVIPELERWYDVTIHIENRSNLNCGLTAEIEEERLEDVLKLLATTHQISYTFSDKEVFIKGTLCK